MAGGWGGSFWGNVDDSSYWEMVCACWFKVGVHVTLCEGHAGSAISMLWSSSKVRSMLVLLGFAGVKRCVSSGASHSGWCLLKSSSQIIFPFALRQSWGSCCDH